MVSSEKKQREKEIIVHSRALAVFLIVMAHCTALPVGSTLLAQKIMEICSSVSFFGVWIFFMLGGYLLRYEKRPFLQFAQRKGKTLVVPWVFTGILVYLYTNIRHGGVSIISMLQFVVGYGSYLWYMSVFVALLALFAAARRMRAFPYVFIALWMLVEITRIQYKFAGTDYKLYYYFVGAWPVAFGLGYLINQDGVRDKFVAFVRKYGALFAAVALTAIIAVFSITGKWYYWSWCYIPLCALLTPGMLWLVLVLKKVLGKVLDEIGSMSFSIYLLHMPVAGIVSNLLCRFDGGFTIPLRPFIVIAITWAGIRLISWIAEKIRSAEVINLLIGRR